MPLAVAGATEGASRHSRDLRLRGAPRPELAAAAVAALLIQLLLAPLTLAIAICLGVVDRWVRWRPAWLTAPAALGLAWALSVGVRPALTGYLAGAGHVIGYLTGPGPAFSRPAPLPRAFAGWRDSPPLQLPVPLNAPPAQPALPLP